jgi:amino-acid N-acetyltransferase
LDRAHPPGVSAAKKADLLDVLALLRRCQLLENGVAEAFGSFCVARASGKLVGCAGLEGYGELGLLRSVAVSESARGAGLGTKLVDFVAATARTRGLSRLFLLTTTAPAFFERLGFKVMERSAVPAAIAESWEFRVGCPQTAVAMRFELKES